MTNTPTAKRQQMDAWLARLDPGIKARFDAAFDAQEAAKKMVAPAQQAGLDATEDGLLSSAKLLADTKSQAGTTAARSTPADPTVATKVGAPSGGPEESVASDAKPTISISPDRATIDPTGNQRFTATVDYPDGTSRLLTDAEWTSSDPAVTVNANGLAMALRAQGAKKTILATITATDPESGVQGTAQILVEPSQPAPMSKQQEYEANAAYYASERQSQLEPAAKAHAEVREGVPKMSAAEIDSQWNDDDKEDFIAVAASPTHTLKREQLLQIFIRYWGDRVKAAQKELLRDKDNLKAKEAMAANERAEGEYAQANSMLGAAVTANEVLIAAEDQGKHLTLGELNQATWKASGFERGLNDQVSQLTNALLIAGVGEVGEVGEVGAGGVGEAPRLAEPVVRPVEVKEPTAGGGGGPTEPPTGKSGRSPSRPPAKTIEASPPPPPKQTSRPGAPTPVTDVEVVKTNVDSPASIKVQSPGPHQTDWTARGGTGKAPAAYRDSEGNLHVSSDHPLMGDPKRGGIPPVRSGGPTSPGQTPSRTQPAPGSTPTKSGGDIGLEQTGKAPAPAKPPVDPGAKTPPAPPKAAPVPKDAPTGGAAAESKRAQASRGQIDPPQEVSRQVVENIRNRPRTVDPRRKGSGSNVGYTTDHEAHELAWRRLGGHGDSPPAFIYDNQVYLDPSRWKD